MKSYKSALIVLVSAVALLCGSCYPEGGGGLVDPDYRIVNVWSLSHAYCDNVEVDSTTFDMDQIYYQGFMPGVLYYIYSDHVMNVLCVYHNQVRQSTFSTWVIDKHEKTLTLDYTLLGRHYAFTADIMKLTRRELFIEFDEDDHHWRLEMYSQTGY
ncbi:MAG: hypothetical protein K6A41_03245 [Bacteroidales bacterium]|nr:hypothetical protein [Bacteroidales bacterium]